MLTTCEVTTWPLPTRFLLALLLSLLSGGTLPAIQYLSQTTDTLCKRDGKKNLTRQHSGFWNRYVGSHLIAVKRGRYTGEWGTHALSTKEPPLCSSLQQNCFPSENERKRFLLEVQMDLAAFPQTWNCAQRKAISNISGRSDSNADE